MPKLKLEEFKTLIELIPIQRHAVEVESAFWKRLFDDSGNIELHKKIFPDDNVKLSRQKILNEKNPNRKAAMILLWGYPKGIQGRQHEDFLLNLDSISEICEKAVKDKTLWPDFYKKFDEIEGIGISTITKLAYFFKLEFEEKNALILDRRIIEILRQKFWLELQELSDVTYSQASKKYPKYLATMTTVAAKIGVQPAQLEFFLFSLGGSFI